MEDPSWPAVTTPPPGSAKYQWVKRALLQHIERDLSPGEPVPSERELADRFGVSRMTARRALSDLVVEGRVFREVGRGSYVATPSIRLPLQLTSFTVDMDARGMRPGARTVSRDTIPAGDRLSVVLGLHPDDLVYRLVRLRTADGSPMAIERVHLPERAVPGLIDMDLHDRSLYSILAAEYGLTFDSGEETIRARTASQQEAQLLGVHVGDAMLYLVRISRRHGRAMEYTVSSYRGDRYELAVSIH
jgi:GntR family transcriptional regulator